jgi:hypothetical protein
MESATMFALFCPEMQHQCSFLDPKINFKSTENHKQ